MANYNYEVFKRLCDRAQELVFDAISEDATFQFMYVCGLDEALTQMTPIEQIFYLANKIYNEQMIHNKKYELCLDLLPQETIHIKRKNYRVDFLISYYDCDDATYCLKKPIIIEVDGKDWHSSKTQMNYDYKRENELKLAGYDVFRFTGSQIYNNPFGCIEKIYNYVEMCDTIKEEQKSPAIGDDFYDILEDCLGNKRGDKND